jgi:hypothetical protein
MAVALLVLSGCGTTHYVKVRSVPYTPLVQQLNLSTHDIEASPQTLQVLRQYDLVDDLKGDPHKLVYKLQGILEQEPSADKLYAVSELSYRAGRKVEHGNPKQALDYFGTSVAYAYLYLFDERFAALRNPYDPMFRGACDLYNGSLESALRIINKQGKLQPGQTHSIATATQTFDITVVTRGTAWHDDDFDHFEFCSDYEVTGLANQFHGPGLGVPLIAVHKRHDRASTHERYYPPGLSFPVTAFVRLLPDGDDSSLHPNARHRALLELYDPLVSSDIPMGPRRVPLESDLSTPLAYFLNADALKGKNELSLTNVAYEGLLRPDKTQSATGLYMLQPYEPKKIPVIMVHGLWSSPVTWTEMFNDLRSVPEIRDHFQFWFYLYPTGEPFWNSATRFRQDLANIRATVDPQRREAALDQMVLVGHSMGGLVSKLQTIDSGEDFWRIESEKPFPVIKASFETRDKLEHLFFFKANPSIRRVVTIATPHRGSTFANTNTRWLAHKFIKVPQMMSREQVIRENPGVFRDTTLIESTTSLDSLSPNSPVLPVMLHAPRPPWVTYHNIVGVVPDKGILGAFAKNSDGVVNYESAHLSDVESEIIVPADHMTVHRHPRSVLEVRRILLEHLAELNGPPPQSASPVITATIGNGPPLPAVR